MTVWRLTRAYLDTSAAGKLLIDEPESAALARWADGEDVEPVGTFLLETELRRLAVRTGTPQSAVTAVLDRVSLYDLAPSVFREAGLLPDPGLRALDALHLAAAIRLEVDVLVAYDRRLLDAAPAVGLPVLSPR